MCVAKKNRLQTVDEQGLATLGRMLQCHTKALAHTPIPSGSNLSDCMEGFGRVRCSEVACAGGREDSYLVYESLQQNEQQQRISDPGQLKVMVELVQSASC